MRLLNAKDWQKDPTISQASIHSSEYNRTNFEKIWQVKNLPLFWLSGLTPLNRRSLHTVQGLLPIEFGQVTLPLIESIKQW